MGHFPGFIGADIPGQGPKLILSVRRNTQFRIDPSGIAELTRPARERLEPVVPSGEFEFRTPSEVVKGLGLGFDAERSLELAVRQWIAEPDLVRFRKSLYQSLRSFAPGNYAVRNEIARRAQGLWKASRGGAWSRVPGREGEREIVQKASQMGLFGVTVNKPAPKTVGAAPAAPAVSAANKPPQGFTPIPGSTRGGYHKRVGAKFVYWYPDTGVVEKPHAQDAAAVHIMHNVVHAALGGYQAEVVKVPPKPTPAPVEAAPPAAQPAPAPAPEPKRTVVIDKPPPGGWRPEDKVPPRAVAPVVVPQPPAVIPGPIVPQVAPAAFAEGFTVGAGHGGQRLADQAAEREKLRAQTTPPPPAEGPKLVVPVKPAVAEEWGWKRRAREAAEAAARAAAGQTPQAVTPSKVEEASHGEATPGTAAQGGAGHRRLVDPSPRGTGSPDPGARGVGTAPGREASPEAVIARVDKLGANPPATETTGELGLDKREVPTPTPASRKEATTVAEQWLPPIREPLPDNAVNFPVPQPIVNSRGEVVDHIRTLFPHQKEGAERILQAWQERDGIILQDDAGLGKAQPIQALTLTPSGWREIGALQVGDLVVSSDGQPTRVRGVYPRGILATYQVRFSDGTELETGHDHLWTFYYRAGGKRWQEITVTTADLHNRKVIEVQQPGRTSKLDLGKSKLYLPMLSGPAEFEGGALPIPAYTLGQLIANGGLTSPTPNLTTNALDWPEVRGRLAAEGSVPSSGDDKPGCRRSNFGGTGMGGRIRELGLNVLSGEKRIPRIYLQARSADRVALFQGLMDADGSVSKTRNRLSYSTASAGLADDVRELVECLGGIASVREYDRADEGKPIEYQVRIRVPAWLKPFTVGRKARRYNPGRNALPVRTLVGTEYARDTESVCIAVEAADQLYATEHAILTHNTNTALAALVAHGGRRNLIVVPTTNKEGHKASTWGPSAKLYGIELRAQADVFEGKGAGKRVAVRGGLSATDPGYYVVSYDELTVPVIDPETGKQRKQPGPINAKTGKRGKDIPMREPNPALQGYWDTITYDECHTMVGRDGATGIAASAAIALGDKAKKVLYLSATPFTSITDMHYLTRLGNPNAVDPADRMFGNSAEEFANWAEYVGAVKSGNTVKNPPTWVPRVKIAAKLHVAGATVKRQASLEGAHSKFQQVGMSKLTAEQRQVFDTADAIFTMGEQAMGETIMGMWRTNWAKSYWETLKIPAAIELGKQALAEGKQVALFTSYKAFNHAHLRKVPEKMREIAEKLSDNGKEGAARQMMHLAADAQALVDTLPPATDISTQLVEAFGGGDHVAEIHGNTTKKPGDEQKLYQEGHKRVAVCTQAKGGTGISLHDTSGERPRVQINLSLPWSGRMFDQVAGRSHRLGSKSETTIHWMMGDAESERKMAAIVSDRLRSQGSLCSGDPDIRKDAGMLAAWEASNASSDSDDEAEDIGTLEDLTSALEQDDEEKVLGSEKLVDIRGAFAQYAEQLASGRDLIGEAYRAVQDRKAHEASLAHARAAEQLRAGKNWHVVDQTFGSGRPGYFISAYPAQLPPEHPNHNPENRYRNVSSGFKRSTSEGILKPFGARWNTMENPSGGRRLHGYWVPQESMTKLAEELGVHKRKVDLRTVMARAKAAEMERVEAAKVKKAADDKRFEAELGGIADPHGRKAIMALREHTAGRFKAARYGAYSGKTFWHLTEDRPADGGDTELWTRRHDIEALGGSYRDFPMHGGKGYMVDEAQLPAVASRILGHEDWRKSLVIPDMALDRLLDRCRVRMRMQQTTRPGELIWCAEEVPEELHTRLTLTPPGWPAELLGEMAKGAGHKYIKRTPTGNVKRPWRYWYRLPSGEITSSADIAQGSKFKVAHGGQEGHFEVTGHDKEAGIVHVTHDESKQTAHIRERDLHRMVQSYHAKKTQEAKAAAGEKPAAALPRATMGDLGKNGFDEIHGFAQNADELHQQAALMSKPDREFAVIKQPGGFVLASKRAGQLAPGQVAAGSPEGDKAQAEAQKHGDRAAQIESKIQVVRRDPVTGEETLISGKPPAAPSEAKPATKPEAPKAEAEAPKAEAEAPKPEERKTKLIMRAGKDEAGGKRLKAVPAEYEVVEAGDLIASHNPQSFEERSDYPKGVQERRYHEVEADRTKIDEIARNLEPSLMVNTNPDAINGAPIITEDNVVLGGNGRTMGMQRAYSQYPEQAQQLKDHLVRHARAFGHSSADIERMKHPILVRRIKAGKDPQTLSALGRRMNESLTQGLDPRSAEVALGKHYVNQAVMDSLMHHMDADESLSDFLLNSKSGPFVQQLEQSGIIDQFNKGEFVDQETGLLNEDGRHRVERVLAARIIPDAGLLSRMNQKARESIAKAVPYLSQMEAKGWDIKKAIELAVRADIEQRHDKLYDAKDPKAGRELYLAQTEQEGMGGSGIRGKVNGDEVARAMFDVIQDHMGVKKFPAAVKQVALEADRQHHDHGDQGAMFQREKVEPAEAIRHAFKLPGKKKTTAPAEEAAPKVRKPRRKKGEAAAVQAPTPVAEPEAPGKGWETARRQEAGSAATPALFGGGEPPEHVQAAQAREAALEYDRARGRAVEDMPPPPPPEDTRTLGMFGMAMPPTTWHKAEVGDGGLGRYVMHAITWEAKNLVRAAVGAARPGEGIDGARVLKRLRAFVQEQTEQDRDFARGLGAHPVNDATLRGLVQAAAGAHVSHLAKSLAIHSLWKDWCKSSARL